MEDIAHRLNGIREKGWIAEKNSGRPGCIFCEKETNDTAKLRLFLLVPSAHGAGLGNRLLKTCMGFAQSSGYSEIYWMTHERNEAAFAPYRSADGQPESARPVHAFGRDLVEQTWCFRF